MHRKIKRWAFLKCDGLFIKYQHQLVVPWWDGRWQLNRHLALWRYRRDSPSETFHERLDRHHNRSLNT
ncbi:MAG: hypothetical protein KME42_12065 [Tildeniella nuda ZEHNDER 1965/U140]|nr:hypothetical protein [Tildeniella nuda ZEHNDER 1965/U140]